MNIIEKMQRDLEQVKALKNHSKQFNEESIAMEIVIEDYKEYRNPSNLYNWDIEFNEQTLEKDAFTFALNYYKRELEHLQGDSKAYFRDNYLRRYVYCIRILGYYSHLFTNKMDGYQAFINKNRSLYKDAVSYWDDELYFFSPQMNGESAGIGEQETVFDDEIIDIAPIMKEQKAIFEKLENQSEEFRRESIALDIAVDDYFSYQDLDFLMMINLKLDGEFPEFDAFNHALAGLEKQLGNYCKPTAPLRDVYMERFTFAIRMLSYYFSIYMKSDYQNIIETYEKVYPEALVYWRKPLYFFSEEMNNVPAFKPRCPHCNKNIETPVKNGNVAFCSKKCANETLWLSTQFSTLQNIAGLSTDEMKLVLGIHNWGLDTFASKLDEINDVLKKGYAPTQALVESFKNRSIYDQLYTNLKSYHVNTGGKNFKGFVFEELHAKAATLKGTPTTVIGDNSIADFIIRNADGTITFGQGKAGYQNTYIDFSKYEGQLMIVDKGNVELKLRAEKAGLQVIESPVSLRQADTIANAMKVEKKVYEYVTGNAGRNAPITSAAVSIADAGLKSARYGGLASAGYSIGNNTVELLYGEKTLQEAGISIAKDTAIGTASSMGIGMAIQGTSIAVKAVASTKLGVMVSGAATTVSGALAGTTAGGALIASTAMIGSAVATTTTAISTVAATMIGSTLAATTAGAAFVAGAPIVIAASVIGGTIALGKRLLRGY